MLEDYADEWLWRPAMHYRWDYTESAKHQGRVLAEADDSVPIPSFVKSYVICNRQRKFFTVGDGVTTETWDHVEKTFHDTLDQFAAILESRPYLLGDRPSLADFGFFGPMFRHFSMDPTSARIMRETAPSVFEWVARTWNARVDTATGDLLDEVPDDWEPILCSIGSTYLPHLCANADAWRAGKSHFDVTIEGTLYRDIRTSVYRVWCLDELRRRFEELSVADQEKSKKLLKHCNCWEPLWNSELPESARSMNPDVPFRCVGPPTGMSRKAAESLYWLPVLAPQPPKQREKENVMATTALVTGASSGIGQEIARLHARKGGNLVLVARSEIALNDLKQELEKANGIKATVIVADLAQPHAANMVFDATEAAGIQVDMLINNAGVGGHGMFHERELDSDRAMMQVNMTALVDLTHLYLPGMRARGHGKILQVASTAGMTPGTLQAVYFASKSFVLSFSQAISEELSGTGVTCTALCPGAVETGFAAAGNLEDAALFSKPGASAASVAECGYKAMLNGDLVTINDPVISIVLTWIMPLLPRKLALKIARKSMEKV